MDIPLELQLHFLEGYHVCHFKDAHYPEESPSHYYISVPTNNDCCLIICLISSKLDKYEKYYTRHNAKCLESLIRLNRNALSFLTMPSFIDCNKAEYIHKNELKSRIVLNSYEFISDTIPEDLKQKIIRAIQKSPSIKPYIKEMLLKKSKF